jgi:uncharacterized protein (TIGR02996 family)
MLAIGVSRVGVAPWRKTFVAPSVFIGRARNNHLVLDDPGDATVLTLGNGLEVFCQEGAAIFVDGQKLPNRKFFSRPPRIFSRPQCIQIADYTLEISMVLPQPIGGTTVQIRAPLEQQLLDAIAAGDNASRLIYADWLEDCGDHARAAFLRAQHAMDGMTPDYPAFERHIDELRELAAKVDMAWRARVAQRTIEGCLSFDFACPQQWSALATTAREGVRHCANCRQDVYYCASIEEAREHAGQGRCVAVDVTSPRWKRDLDKPFGRYMCMECGVDIGPGLNDCPSCLAPLQRRVIG